MTVIDIYSGFLGAGKTTLIKKMISEAYQGQKLVLIENEFGEIGIDGGFLKEAGIQITEMNSGCICCSLVGDFGAALKQVIHDYHPDRILIEPSGVGKLSDVMVAVQKAAEHEAVLGATVAVADASKVKLYMKNFGEFYNNQIETAGCIVLSRTQNVPEAKLKAAVELIRQHNDHATLVTTPWDELTGEQLKEAMEANPTLADMMRELIEAHEREEAEHEAEHHHHHHHHDEHDGEEHEHHHHHHDDEEEHEHHHHDHDEDEHHHHDHDEDEHEHHHHYDENGVCECGHHHGEDEEHEHHHHHHHADEVFTSWGRETTKQYTEQEIRNALGQLDNALEYGIILRAKGIVPAADGRWIHFDHVPGEIDVRFGPADVIGKLCVIGSKIDEQAIAELFGL
ncbi:MAG: GTP-binding protein [Oscillospiraceae bacterium]|nr:GTP-binding protein [Oscillospiraceae bacterium]MBR4656909.1 GTP-binding protein [Oscillospiraceae bacterium]